MLTVLLLMLFGAPFNPQVAGGTIGGTVQGLPAPQGPPRDQAQRPVTGNSSISGRVATADSGMPVRRATISLSGTSVPRRSVYTDAEGRYAFTGLPAGTYQLNASPGTQRGHYLAAAYGPTATGPLVRPTPIELAAGQQMTDVNIALPRGSAISGTVTDESGEPLARVQVSAMLVRRGGEPMQTGGAQTDDHGRYRLFGLQPGEYTVVAEARDFGGTEVQGEAVGFARAYAPGTPSLLQAQRVRLTRGTEASADIRLGETPLFKITGRVMDSSGQPVRPQSVSVQSTAEGSRNGFGFSTRNNNLEFTVGGLPAGQYEITVRHDPGRAVMTGSMGGSGGPPPPPPPPGPGADSRVEMASMVIDVSADVEGVVLITQPGATVSGEFVFEEPAEGRRAQVSTVNAGRPNAMTNPASAEVTENGFTLKGLFGPVLIRGTVNGPGWALKAVLLNGKDITDVPTTLTTKDSGHLQVVFTSRAAAIEALVTDASGKPTRESIVVVFGRDEQTWVTRSSMTRIVGPDKDGKLTVRGLRDGEYYAVAVAPEDWTNIGNPDTEMLRDLSKVATRVSVTAGETRTVDLMVTRLQ